MRYVILKNGRCVYKVNSRVLADAYAREFGARVGVSLRYLCNQVGLYSLIVLSGVGGLLWFTYF